MIGDWEKSSLGHGHGEMAFSKELASVSLAFAGAGGSSEGNRGPIGQDPEGPPIMETLTPSDLSLVYRSSHPTNGGWGTGYSMGSRRTGENKAVSPVWQLWFSVHIIK